MVGEKAFILLVLLLSSTFSKEIERTIHESVVVKKPATVEEDLDLLRPISTGHDGVDWTYERLRDSLTDFNNGFFEYADRLSSQIKTNYLFKSKYATCMKKVAAKEIEKRHGLQDKVNLQEGLQDLQAKYDALEQALEKVEDINDDSKESITRLRAHRDRCVQNHSSRQKTIESLREEATELRRQIAHTRSQSG